LAGSVLADRELDDSGKDGSDDGALLDDESAISSGLELDDALLLGTLLEDAVDVDSGCGGGVSLLLGTLLDDGGDTDSYGGDSVVLLLGVALLVQAVKVNHMTNTMKSVRILFITEITLSIFLSYII
jgi:hypothetical protein